MLRLLLRALRRLLCMIGYHSLYRREGKRIVEQWSHCVYCDRELVLPKK